jgi:glucose-1-phosphate adenylyltransferase
VLSAGVFVGPKAVVKDSVILSEASIGAGARVERTIVDKQVRIGRKARIGAAVKGEPAGAITMIGKGAEIAAGATVTRGSVIESDARPEPAKT